LVFVERNVPPKKIDLVASDTPVLDPGPDREQTNINISQTKIQRQRRDRQVAVGMSKGGRVGRRERLGE
jgi:hypothetical protein